MLGIVRARSRTTPATMRDPLLLLMVSYVLFSEGALCCCLLGLLLLRWIRIEAQQFVLRLLQGCCTRNLFEVRLHVVFIL